MADLKLVLRSVGLVAATVCGEGTKDTFLLSDNLSRGFYLTSMFKPPTYTLQQWLLQETFYDVLIHCHTAAILVQPIGDVDTARSMEGLGTSVKQ